MSTNADDKYQEARTEEAVAHDAWRAAIDAASRAQGVTAYRRALKEEQKAHDRWKRAHRAEREAYHDLQAIRRKGGS